MQLETKRLTLRSFREEDIDRMAQLFANPDFMRFSLGVFTERKQTVAFIEKVTGWDRAGIPSQFAVVPRGEDVIIGYCGFFYHPEHGIEDIEIGYRLDPRYWNRGLITEAARAVRDHGFRDRGLSARHLTHSPKKRPLASRGGEKWNEGRQGNYVSRFSDAGVCDNAGGVGGGACRLTNSRASAR